MLEVSHAMFAAGIVALTAVIALMVLTHRGRTRPRRTRRAPEQEPTGAIDRPHRRPPIPTGRTGDTDGPPIEALREGNGHSKKLHPPDRK